MWGGGGGGGSMQINFCQRYAIVMDYARVHTALVGVR